MFDYMKTMLSETGTASSLRAMSFMSLLIGGGCAFYGLWKGIAPLELSALVGVFVGSAFGGKVLQKKAEQKAAAAEEEDKLEKSK